MKEFICKLCGCEQKEEEYPQFCYTNKPIVSKKLLKNVQGWGNGRCLEVTYDDGNIEKLSEDTEFFKTPQMKYYSSYIVRKSKPNEILSIWERMENGYIVCDMKDNYYYIPKYKDLLSLGYNKDYKHPDLSAHPKGKIKKNKDEQQKQTTRRQLV